MFYLFKRFNSSGEWVCLDFREVNHPGQMTLASKFRAFKPFNQESDKILMDFIMVGFYACFTWSRGGIRK